MARTPPTPVGCVRLLMILLPKIKTTELPQVVNIVNVCFVLLFMTPRKAFWCHLLVSSNILTYPEETTSAPVLVWLNGDSFLSIFTLLYPGLIRPNDPTKHRYVFPPLVIYLLSIK